MRRDDEYVRSMNDVDVPVRLRRAAATPPAALDAFDRREVVTTLLDIYALHLAPLELVEGVVDWQHDPRVAATKQRLEARFRASLDDDGSLTEQGDAVDGMRQLAHDEMVPPLYDWLAEAASRSELVAYLAVEGGPDADFDDLVALGQVGLTGRPKLTLAANYW